MILLASEKSFELMSPVTGTLCNSERSVLQHVCALNFLFTDPNATDSMTLKLAVYKRAGTRFLANAAL